MTTAAHDLLGRVQIAQGRVHAAFDTYQQLAANLDDDPATLDRRFGANVWAPAEIEAGQVATAEGRLRRAFQEAVELLGNDSGSVVEIGGFLGMARLAAGDRDAALPLLRSAVRALIHRGRRGNRGDARPGCRASFIGARPWRS
jgi:hypothetical protein